MTQTFCYVVHLRRGYSFDILQLRSTSYVIEYLSAETMLVIPIA